LDGIDKFQQVNIQSSDGTANKRIESLQQNRVRSPTQRFRSGVRIAFETYSQKEEPWEIV